MRENSRWIRVLYLDKELNHFSRVEELLQNDERFALLSSANSVKFKEIINEKIPDILIINCGKSLPAQAFSILEWIKITHFKIRSVVIAAHQEYIHKCLELGASGFLLHESIEQLPLALDSVSKGKLFYPTLTGGALKKQKQNQSIHMRETWLELTEHEKQVIALTKLGWTPLQIASIIKVTEAKLGSLTKSVLDKTNQPSLLAVVDHYIDLVEELIE